jgi:hypothetical protein
VTIGIGGASFNIPQPDPDGSNALILQVGPSSSAATQTFSAPTSGPYTLSLFAANRSTFGVNGKQTIQLAIDGSPIATLTDIPTAWTFESFTFNEIAGNHSLTLTGLGAGTQDVAAFIDNVSLTAGTVSLPGTAWLLLSGLAGLNILRRTRRPR